MSRPRASGPELIGARRAVELLARHDVRPLKRLGQNFIIDPNTIRKIVDLARLEDGDHVLEIGAGGGALTVALSSAVRQVTAVEVDPRLAPVLHEVTGNLANVDVVIADALEIDIGAVGANRMIGNLPYNAAGEVILRVLAGAPSIDDLTVMVQREAGERLTAHPGDKLYGATCLQVRFWARAELIGKISRNAFVPIPRVDSVLVRLQRAPAREGVAWSRFAALVQAAFSQRRKTLRNALTAFTGSPEAALSALTSAGIDPGARPEDLDFDAFTSLARHTR